mmetsp:Transcript_112830/g.268812  ORF Transcript_112830/g.268812 Transcript_112830/m.268812 type:complete len:246 (-) Transcript_112830:181-918(-)
MVLNMVPWAAKLVTASGVRPTIRDKPSKAHHSDHTTSAEGIETARYSRKAPAFSTGSASGLRCHTKCCRPRHLMTPAITTQLITPPSARASALPRYPMLHSSGFMKTQQSKICRGELTAFATSPGMVILTPFSAVLAALESHQKGTPISCTRAKRAEVSATEGGCPIASRTLSQPMAAVKAKMKHMPSSSKARRKKTGFMRSPRFAPWAWLQKVAKPIVALTPSDRPVMLEYILPMPAPSKCARF